LCCFSTTSTRGKLIFRHDSIRKLLDTPSYGDDISFLDKDVNIIKKITNILRQ